MLDEPLCRPCRSRGVVAPAEHVDHHVPRNAGGTDDRHNLVPMCHPCHSAKTAREDGGFGRAKKDRPDA